MNRPFTAALLRRALVLSVLSVPMFASASVPARADSLTADDILSQFNAVVSNNFSTNSDVEGRLVAGNINNSVSSTFYESPNSASSPSSFQGVNALTNPELPELQRQQRRQRKLHHEQFRLIQFQWRWVAQAEQPGLRDERLHHASQRAPDPVGRIG